MNKRNGKDCLKLNKTGKKARCGNTPWARKGGGKEERRMYLGQKGCLDGESNRAIIYKRNGEV